MSSETEMEWHEDVTVKDPKAEDGDDVENNHPSKKTCRKLGALCKHMKNFMNQPELSDVMLRFAGKQYRAHRLILGAWSPVLEDKLSLAAKDERSKGTPNQPFVLDLDDASLTSDGKADDTDKAFQEFMNFMYSGKADLTETVVKTVLGLAQIYKIKTLQEICEEYIGREIGKHNVEKALDWLSEAERKGLDILQEKCIKVLQVYIQFIPDKAWQALRLDQLLSIVKADEVVIEDEYALFMKIESWIKSEHVKEEDLWPNLDQILPHIRFCHMTVWQLQQFSQSRLGKLIYNKHSEIVSNALKARALASEEMDFTEVSQSQFAPPRLYLKFSPPGQKLSSVKESKKDVYTRARCATNMSSYSERRALVWRKLTGGLYCRAESESWEVSVFSRQNNAGTLWRLQFLLIPRYDHISQNYKLVISIKLKEDVQDPINITHCGTVVKSTKPGRADGIVLFTPYTIQDKPEFAYVRDVVFIG